MFYTHDAQQARAEQAADKVAASALHAEGTDAWYAEVQTAHLRRIGERGLPDCYDSFDAFLYDFYPDFSLDAGRWARQIQLVLEGPEFPAIEARLAELFGVSMRASLLRALQAWQVGAD